MACDDTIYLVQNCKLQFIIFDTTPNSTMPKFSTGFQETPRLAILHNRLFYCDTPVLQAGAIRYNHAVGKQYVGIHDGSLTTFTLPILHPTNQDTNVVLASRGDELGFLLPVTLPESPVAGWVAAVVPFGAVNNLSLPFLPDDLTTVPAPPPLDKDAEPTVPNMARLNYRSADRVADNPDFTPCMALVPKLYLVTPGEIIPFGHHLLDDLTEEVDLTNPFHTWFYAHQHNQRTMAGTSQHIDNVVLDWTVLRTHEFDNRILSHNSEVIFLGLDTTSPSYLFYQEMYKAEVAELQTTQPNPNIDAPGEQPNLLPPGTLAQMAGLVAAMQNNNPTNNSKTDRDHDAEVNETTQRWRMFLARVVTVTDPVSGEESREVVYPTIRQSFLQTIRFSTAGARQSAAQEDFGAFKQNRPESSDVKYTYATFKSLMFDTPFTNVVCRGKFATESPAVNPEQLKTHLAFFHMANPKSRAVKYEQRVFDGNLQVRQHMIGIVPSSQRNTDLYHTGHMATTKDMNTAAANFYMLADFIINDLANHMPTVLAKIFEYLAILRSSPGRSYCERNKPTQQIFHHFMLNMNTIWMQQAALAMSQEACAALLSGATIDPSNFDNAARIMDHTITKLNNVIASDSSNYHNMPSAMMHFYPPASLTDQVGSRKRPGGHLSPGYMAPVGSHGQHPVRPRVAQENARGMLKWTGDSCARAPVPPVTATHQVTRAPVNLCLNFLFSGKACVCGRDCPFVHLHNIRDLPSELQTLFVNWVRNTPNVDWAIRPPPPPCTPRTAAT